MAPGIPYVECRVLRIVDQNVKTTACKVRNTVPARLDGLTLGNVQLERGHALVLELAE
jgi:hypothetical protein